MEPSQPTGSSADFTVFFVVLGAGFAGCVGGEAPEVTSDDPVLVEGRELYIRNCVGCHGVSGGGGTGPKLNDGNSSKTYPDIADQIDVVVNGRKNMPAFGGKLDNDQVEAVVRYTREVL